MEDLKVSILIPVYNVEPYIEKCLDSVLNQSYKNLEIIIVDDGSSDDSYEICRKYADKDRRIQLIHQENKGISAVRNLCLTKASGQYVLFIDSDDWIDLKMVGTLVDLACQNNADIAACKTFRTIDDRAVAHDRNTVMRVYSPKDYINLMTKPAGLFCYPCTRLIRRELFQPDIFPVGKIFEDLACMPRIVFGANKVVQTNERLYYYRFRRTGLSHGKFSYRALDEMDGYILLVDFADEIHDKRIAKNGILFFLTKYYYYKFKVLIHRMDYVNYKKTYSKIAHNYIVRFLITGGNRR